MRVLIVMACAAACVGSSVRAPYGTNFGGWLNLEDWFFSGQDGRYVMTQDTDLGGQGHCLPPGLPETQAWSSEGLLTKRLNDTEGPEKTADYFTAYRVSFIGESDFRKIKELGIKVVRVPITWAAFADALAYIDPVAYGSHNPSTDTAVVPDPFYTGTHALVTIPRDWLAMKIREAHTHGIKILLDIHSMPGGSSIGTYNGIWPADPMFWGYNSSIGNRSVSLQDAGLSIAKALVDWVENLDKETQDGVAGVTLMNEPAHMAAIQKKDGVRYVEEATILAWLQQSSDIFRRSKLPTLGMKLYVNLIETAFHNFTGTVAPWFKATFTKDERNAWAVVDVHWYTAWSNGGCDGRTDKGGRYFCDEPLADIQTKLQSCTQPWAQIFAENFDGLKACSEFSVGTNQDARFACNDRDVLRMFLSEQVIAMENHSIEPFFWSWRMPYGSVFENGWSLKNVAGLEEKTAEQCIAPTSEQSQVVLVV